MYSTVTSKNLDIVQFFLLKGTRIFGWTSYHGLLYSQLWPLKCTRYMRPTGPDHLAWWNQTQDSSNQAKKLIKFQSIKIYHFNPYNWKRVGREPARLYPACQNVVSQALKHVTKISDWGKQEMVAEIFLVQKAISTAKWNLLELDIGAAV